MYKSFEAENFKCFHNFKITDLKRINLIAGKNNVGKTALLEAFFIHAGAYNPELVLRVNVFRGIETVKLEFGWWTETPWASIFRDFNINGTMELIGEIEETGLRVVKLKVIHKPNELERYDLSKQREKMNFSKRDRRHQQNLYYSSVTQDKERPGRTPLSSEVAQILELEYKEGRKHGKWYMISDAKGLRTEPIAPSPPFQVIFLPSKHRVGLLEDAERFGKLEISYKQDILLEALRVVEPRLKRLSMAVVGGNPMIHGDIGVDRLMPLPLMGDGMVRLASLILAIGNAQNGIVLVDEIENGFHYSILPKVWSAIGEAAQKFETQVFATTHSLECIKAAHKAFTESSFYDFRLHRLERINEKINEVTYDQEDLTAAIETDFEVR
jgi:AAA15 family ATPase/GTPase